MFENKTAGEPQLERQGKAYNVGLEPLRAVAVNRRNEGHVYVRTQPRIQSAQHKVSLQIASINDAWYLQGQSLASEPIKLRHVFNSQLGHLYNLTHGSPVHYQWQEGMGNILRTTWQSEVKAGTK
ncbi:hypothetical protein BaRGS_00001521 [Batillaria attramentaria]|uniref:Uncharacterized protein n=1 Tax=Batillaria attramentaria TaxID=370345 RepID=A0ABD0M8A8_9CAEN